MASFSVVTKITRLKSSPTKYFYQLVFLLNKHQITEIFKKRYHIYHTVIWLSGVDQSNLVNYTDSSSEEDGEDLGVDVNFDEPIDLAIN